MDSYKGQHEHTCDLTETELRMKAKPFEVQTMWAQRVFEPDILKVQKVACEANEAYVLKKHVPIAVSDRMSETRGYWHPYEDTLEAQDCDKL